MNSRSMLQKIVVSSFAILSPSLAFAHPGGHHIQGLISGLTHPLFGLDHLLAMAAVGAIGGRIGMRGAILVPLAFVSAMVAAAALGIAEIALPAVETGIALSLIVFGAALSQIGPLPIAAALSIAALFGLFHGNAHGLEIPQNSSGLAYAAGFVLATSALHAAGVLSALKLCRWPPILRTAGFGASLVGIFLAVQVV